MNRNFIFAALLSIGLTLAGCAGMAGVKDFWQLSPADFQPIKAGMTQGAVEQQVGKPPSRMSFPAKGEEVWTYYYLEYHTHMRSIMTFDGQGVLKSMKLEYDADYYSSVA